MREPGRKKWSPHGCPVFLKGFDFSLKQGEISDAALRNGFRSVFKQTVNMLTGPMDVDVARK